MFVDATSFTPITAISEPLRHLHQRCSAQTVLYGWSLVCYTEESLKGHLPVGFCLAGPAAQKKRLVLILFTGPYISRHGDRDGNSIGLAGHSQISVGLCVADIHHIVESWIPPPSSGVAPVRRAGT